VQVAFINSSEKNYHIE